MEPYRPSNGTEGDWFMAQWCKQCWKHPKNPEAVKQCDILGRALGHDINDPHYPKQWVRDGDGPRCTSFEAQRPDYHTPRCRKTADLFEASA